MIWKRALFLGIAFILTSSVTASAQTSCTVSRDQVLADAAAGDSDETIRARYAGCTAAIPSGQAQLSFATRSDQTLAPPPQVPIFASESISNPGNSSTYWEAIKSCGYHPQREEAACTIEIRQRFGYGGPPAINGGSFEWLLFCVDFGGGYVPINTSGLHIHDEPFGVQPNWSQAAIIQANPQLQGLNNNGQTVARARVIMSWFLNPNNNCNYVPIWGNRSDFRFKLDP